MLHCSNLTHAPPPPPHHTHTRAQTPARPRAHTHIQRQACSSVVNGSVLSVSGGNRCFCGIHLHGRLRLYTVHHWATFGTVFRAQWVHFRIRDHSIRPTVPAVANDGFIYLFFYYYFLSNVTGSNNKLHSLHLLVTIRGRRETDRQTEVFATQRNPSFVRHLLVARCRRHSICIADDEFKLWQ